WRSATAASGKGPGSRRVTLMAPTASPWRSIGTERPSTHPSFWRPPPNASTLACASGAGSAYPISLPIRRSRSACCPSTASNVASMLPLTTAMNARRSISLCLLDDLVSSDEDGLRDRQTQGLGGLDVDGQLEFGGLLHWEVGRIRSFENL